MLARLGSFTVRRRRLILVAAVVAFAVSGAVGGGVASKLPTGEFQDPAAESTQVEDYLLEHFPAAGTPNIILLVTADDGLDVDTPEVAATGAALTAELGSEPGMDYAVSYWSTGGAPPLKTADGHRALVLARLGGNQDDVIKAMDDLTPKYSRHAGGIEVRVGGYGEIFHEVSQTIEHDLTRAELIALPITLLLLLLVFGSAVAALVPLAIGGLSIVGTFFILIVLNHFTDVSVFSLNLTTGMGLGLAVDYSLFVVSRYREELRAGFEPNEAVVRTVRTAGRTVAFSALTVAAGACSLPVAERVRPTGTAVPTTAVAATAATVTRSRFMGRLCGDTPPSALKN